MGFNSRSEFSLYAVSIGKNVVIFGADIRSSVHIDNKGEDILILGKGATQGLNNTLLIAETQHSSNIESNSFLFVNATKVLQFKAKNSKIKDYVLCLGNIIKDLAINIKIITGLKRVVKFFFG